MGSKINRILLRILEIILNIFISLVFFSAVFPVLLTCVTVGLIWRYLAVLWTKIFRKDIVKIMGGMDPVLAIDDMFTRPLSTIVVMSAFEQGLTYEDCVANAKRILGEKIPGTDQFVCPEYRRYFVRRLGFYWWKNEEDFNEREHVKLWNAEDPEKVITEDDYIDIVAELESRPFPKDKSPWELHYIKNCKMQNVPNPEVPKSLCVYRFHHGLADGVSILQTFMKHFFGKSFEDNVPQRQIAKQGTLIEVLIQIFLFIQLPYQFFRQVFFAWDVNEWHLPERKLTRKVHKAWSEKIPVDVVREVKNGNSVGFTAVLVGAIAGAVRKMMVQRDIPVPKKMHALVPFPWPGRPKKICNHWSYVFVPLPVGVADGKERLRKAHKYLECLKRSSEAYCNFTVLKYIGLMPAWVIEKLSVSCYLPTVTFSNFPGPTQAMVGQGGFTMVDTMFTVGPTRGNRGIVVDMMSYNGAVRILSGVDSAILPTQQLVQDFVDLIRNELITLKNQDVV